MGKQTSYTQHMLAILVCMCVLVILNEEKADQYLLQCDVLEYS